MTSERLRRVGDGGGNDWGFGLCKAVQYDEKMPGSLLRAIHPDEFSQSIGRINAHVVVPRAQRRLYCVMLANGYAACCWIPLAAAAVGLTSTPVLPFIIVVTLFVLVCVGLLLHIRRRIIDLTRDLLRHAIASENAIYANRQPAVHWLYDDSRVLVDKSRPVNNLAMLLDVIVEVGPQPTQVIVMVPGPGQPIPLMQGGLPVQPGFSHQQLPQQLLPHPQGQPRFPQQPQQWMAAPPYAEQVPQVQGVTAPEVMKASLLSDAETSDL
jgi:hypothetical protein